MGELTRRRLLSGTAALAGVVLLGGCDADDGDPPATVTGVDGEPTAGDRDLLGAAAALERSLADTYGAILGARSDELAGLDLADRMALYREHHDEHARSLDLLTGDVESISALPGFVVPTADDVVDLPPVQLASELGRLEDVIAQTYRDTVHRLSMPSLRQVAASIGAAEAGHAVVYDLVLAGGLAGYDVAATPGGLYPVDRSAFR